jgi:hypothetical protein
MHAQGWAHQGGRGVSLVALFVLFVLFPSGSRLAMQQAIIYVQIHIMVSCLQQQGLLK